MTYWIGLLLVFCAICLLVVNQPWAALIVSGSAVVTLWGKMKRL